MSIAIFMGMARWVHPRVRLALTMAVATGAVAASASAQDTDPVLEWNRIALTATVTAAQGPIPQIRSMAIVHVSVHDAVNAITREYATYLHIGRRHPAGSPEAAAIAAAHRALVSLFPAQAETLDAARAASLASRGLSDADPGVAVGEAVALAVVTRRANDGSAQAQFPYTVPGAGTPGVFVPIGTQQPLLPGWGAVTPWVIRAVAAFRPEGPPPLGGRRYARDYNEVKDAGSSSSVVRTAEETEMARFWLASPSVIWNSVARGVVQARTLDLSSTARVFALLYLAAADASIVCWDAKYVFRFWRPQAAIRQGDADGNDKTIVDAAWLPLFPTPPHPEYPSAHATNSSAMATVLRHIFGNHPGVPIVATSSSTPGVEREWMAFSEGVEEVIDARIFSGIHFRTADEEGARSGRLVADHVISLALRPLKPRTW